MMDDVVVLVKCPKCNYVQPTRSLKKVRCWKCHTTFKVILTNKGVPVKSRIVGIVRGNYVNLQKHIYREIIFPKKIRVRR